MGLLQNCIWLFSIIVIISSLFPTYETVNTENCEYDMDFTRNIIKIKCNVSAGSTVNVYAENAHVSSEDEVQGHNSGGSGNGRGDRPGKSTKSRVNDNGNNKQPQPDRRRSNKELRSGSTDPDTERKPADQDSYRNWDFSRFESGFSDFVRNATQKLDDAKHKLSNYAGSLKNITNQLAEGDLFLRTDMDNLRRTSNTATELKEGIIAAMRNQYNFMRSALLTHNYELVRVMNSLDVLVDVTADGFHKALIAHNSSLRQIDYLNTTLAAVRKMVSTELQKRHRRRGLKRGNNTKDCPKEISAIGSGFSRKVDTRDGAYMVESYTPNGVSAVWIMRGSKESDQLLEYDVPTDIDYGLTGRYIALPFSCQGTGHAIFRRHFYCYVKDTNTVVKYSLKKMDIVSEVVLPDTHYSSQSYQSDAEIEVDLAVDEMGLWAIYSKSRGKLIISKINHQKMEIEKTWSTKILRRQIGNTFMICGVLYATDSRSDVPTFISYTYSTITSTDQELESGQLPFANAANLLSLKKKHRSHHLADSAMLSYDFRSSMLYSWSNSKVEAFPVYFTKRAH